MSGDKRARRAKRAAKAERRQQPKNNVVPFRRSACVGTEALLAEFRSWLHDTDIERDPEILDGLVLNVHGPIMAIEQVHPGFAVTAWAAEDIDAVLSFAEYMEGKEEGPPALGIALAVRLFIDFLYRTDRWTATEDDWLEVSSALDAYLTTSMPVPSTEIDTDLDPQREASALAQVGVAQRCTAMLGWIGAERQATQARWLKPALLAEFARAVGIPTSPGTKKMTDDPRLADLWLLAEELELISVSTTRVRPGPRADEWQGGPSLTMLRTAVSMATRNALVGGSAFTPETSRALMIRTVYQGMSSAPIPVTIFDDGPEIDPAVSWINLCARTGLQAMIDDGLLTIDADDCYVVPMELRGAVFAALPETVEDATTGLPEGQTLTVSLMMPGIRPPVRRRLAISTRTTLADLHDVIQIAMGWEDSHLHRFVLSADGDEVAFMPSTVIEMGYAPDPEIVPEDDVEIGNLLARPGQDELYYEYDFGDGWEVHISVAAIDDDEAEQPPVMILDGTGVAPLDDVGGIPGWQEFVVAVNDPTHPRYRELRDWAELPAGVDFDATTFDAVATNRTLRRAGL